MVITEGIIALPLVPPVRWGTSDLQLTRGGDGQWSWNHRMYNIFQPKLAESITYGINGQMETIEPAGRVIDLYV